MERLGVVDSHFHRIQINFAPPRRFANFCGAGRTSLIWESENQWLDQKYIFIRNCSLESLPARICWSILSQNTFLKYKIHFFHFLTVSCLCGCCAIILYLNLSSVSSFREGFTKKSCKKCGDSPNRGAGGSPRTKLYFWKEVFSGTT